MFAQDMPIVLFDPNTADAAAWVALTALHNRMDGEYFPEDPPHSVEHIEAQYRNVAAFVERQVWLAWQHGEVAGRGVLRIAHTEENQHAADSDIYVMPEARRQGLGTRLLAQIAAARPANRRLLIGGTGACVPAGDAFMARIGGQACLSGHVNQLVLADLDPALLDAWQAQSQERAAGFVLGAWEGAYPEEEMPAVVQMLHAINHAPRGDLEVEDDAWTPERVRALDAQLFGRGNERWTMYVRDSATGEIAGYTEMLWNPAQPTICEQDGTAVWPKYRNRGLGRWLKAAMLAKVLRERPSVRVVRTGNADSNGPMLKINYELGFKPYFAWTDWQVESDQVEAYLAARAGRALVAV